MTVEQWARKLKRQKRQTAARHARYDKKKLRFVDWWPRFWKEHTAWWNVPALPAAKEDE